MSDQWNTSGEDVVVVYADYDKMLENACDTVTDKIITLKTNTSSDNKRHDVPITKNKKWRPLLCFSLFIYSFTLCCQDT